MAPNQKVLTPSKNVPPKIAQKCLSWIATDAEREDRLGDLEEAFHSNVEVRGVETARRRYIRDAMLCMLFMIRRRVLRAILYGGQDMLNIFLWSIVSVFVIMSCFVANGGEPPVLFQPISWALILLTMLGFALGSNRLGSWGQILQDLRRADRLNAAVRARARSAAIKALLTERGPSAPGSPEASTRVQVRDFAHLETVVELTRASPEVDVDQLISGSIALNRDRCAGQLQIVRATVTDTYIGASIAFILGIIHTLGGITEPPEVLGHLFGGCLCALFFGIIVAHTVVAPIAGRLSNLYSEDFREMEALRASLKGAGKSVDGVEMPTSFATVAFETLMESELGGKFSSSASYSARLSLFLGLPVFVAILCFIALNPIDTIAKRLGFPPTNRPPLTGTVYFALPHITVNLSGPEQPVLDLQLSLVFEGAPAMDAVTTKLPEIMDATLLVLRDLTEDDIRGSGGIGQLRQTLLARVNGMLKPRQISAVLFEQVTVRGRKEVLAPGLVDSR